MQKAHDHLIETFEKELKTFDGPATTRRKFEDVLIRLKNIEFETDKKLLIFDLNGVLIEKEFIPDYEIKKEGWIRVGKSLCRATKLSTELFDFLFNEEGKKKYRVALWTSAYKNNLAKMVKGCFPQHEKNFYFLWGQEECEKELNPKFDPDDKSSKEKPVFFWKNLSNVWEEFPQYNDTNTLIFDDSLQKLEKNPKHCCVMINNETTFANLQIQISY